LFFLLCLNSCRKNLPVPNTAVTIVGKWFATKQNPDLCYNGALINPFTQTNFTCTDFVEYYGDGTGYFSKASSTGISIAEFKYTLSGTALIQYTANNTVVMPLTITSLRANSLSTHAVAIVSDPNNQGAIDQVINEGTFTR
jgi:hypothetical protein